MRQFRIILLLSAAILGSGYKWRCYMFCDEQTNIQGDYIVDRDTCREFAQNNIEDALTRAGNNNSPKARQAKLVSLFSECMGKFGWDVPSGDKKPAEVAVAKAAAPVVATEYRQIQPIIINRTESCNSEYLQTVPKDKKKHHPNKNKKDKKRTNCTPEEQKKLEEALKEKLAEKPTESNKAKEATPQKPIAPEKTTEKATETQAAPPRPDIWKKPAPKPIEKPVIREPLNEAPVNILDKQLSK